VNPLARTVATLAVAVVLVTRTSTGPAVPGGVVAVIALLLTTVTFVAGIPAKLTVALGAKFAPVSVTAVPPTVGPLLGETAVTLGGAGQVKPRAIATEVGTIKRAMVAGFHMTRFLQELCPMGAQKGQHRSDQDGVQ
jgi:hypothetical protein